jgi:hypothetical protein
VLLPPELTRAHRTALVQTFSRELSDRYRNAVDFAIHVPRPHADHRHHHAHLLMTTREVRPDGLGARTTLDMSGTERHARGLGPSKDELMWIRERWAVVTNEALREAGASARIDHRSYKDQGIDREPRATMPSEVLYSERSSGRSTPAGDDIRARHRERVEARLKGGEELARVVQRQKAKDQQRAIQSAERKAGHKKMPPGALTREELSQRRREWRKANAERMNIKQREYRKRRAEHDSAQRWLKLRQQQQPEMKPTQELDPMRQDAAALGRPRPSPSADESVNNWLAYRESQRLAETHSASPGGARDRSVGGTERDTEEAGKDTDRGRKNDAAL